MEKLLAFLLVGAMLLSLCACGEPSSGNGHKNTTQNSQYHPAGDENGLDEAVAALICGTWYPHPEVSGGCIEIPGSVTKLGQSAFMLCTSLKHVVLCEGLTAIPVTAFSNCKALETVTIPASVTFIDYNAFAMCESLKTVYYGGTPEQWAQIQIGNYNEALANAEIVYP